MVSGRHRAPHPGLSRIDDRSLREGAGRPVGQALSPAKLLLGLPFPLELHQRVTKDRRIKYLIRLALGVMSGRGSVRELDNTIFGTIPDTTPPLFFLGRGVRYKFSELKHKTSAPWSAATINLPRYLKFLKPLSVIPLWIRRRMRLKGRSLYLPKNPPKK
jgi:hypothetical protein